MSGKTLADRILKLRQENPSSISTPLTKPSSDSTSHTINSASTTTNRNIQNPTDTDNSVIGILKERKNRSSKILSDIDRMQFNEVPSFSKLVHDWQTRNGRPIQESEFQSVSNTDAKSRIGLQTPNTDSKSRIGLQTPNTDSKSRIGLQTPNTDTKSGTDIQTPIGSRKRRESIRSYRTQYNPRGRVVYGDSSSPSKQGRPSTLQRPLADIIKDMASKSSINSSQNDGEHIVNTYTDKDVEHVTDTNTEINSKRVHDAASERDDGENDTNQHDQKDTCISSKQNIQSDRQSATAKTNNDVNKIDMPPTASRETRTGENMSDCLLQVSNTQSNEQQESNMNYSGDVHSDVCTQDRNGLYIQGTTNSNMHPSQQQGTDKDRPDKTELSQNNPTLSREGSTSTTPLLSTAMESQQSSVESVNNVQHITKVTITPIQSKDVRDSKESPQADQKLSQNNDKQAIRDNSQDDYQPSENSNQHGIKECSQADQQPSKSNDTNDIKNSFQAEQNPSANSDAHDVKKSSQTDKQPSANKDVSQYGQQANENKNKTENDVDYTENNCSKEQNESSPQSFEKDSKNIKLNNTRLEPFIDDKPLPAAVVKLTTEDSSQNENASKYNTKKHQVKIKVKTTTPIENKQEKTPITIRRKNSINKKSTIVKTLHSLQKTHLQKQVVREVIGKGGSEKKTDKNVVTAMELKTVKKTSDSKENPSVDKHNLIRHDNISNNQTEVNTDEEAPKEVNKDTGNTSSRSENVYGQEPEMVSLMGISQSQNETAIDHQQDNVDNFKTQSLNEDNVGLEIHTNVAIDTENIHDCNVDERISKSEENNEVACSNSGNIASIIGKSESKAEQTETTNVSPQTNVNKETNEDDLNNEPIPTASPIIAQASRCPVIPESKDSVIVDANLPAHGIVRGSTKTDSAQKGDPVTTRIATNELKQKANDKTKAVKKQYSKKEKPRSGDQFRYLVQTYVRNIQEEQIFSAEIVDAIASWKESTVLKQSRELLSNSARSSKEKFELESNLSTSTISAKTMSTRNGEKQTSSVEDSNYIQHLTTEGDSTPGNADCKPEHDDSMAAEANAKTCNSPKDLDRSQNNEDNASGRVSVVHKDTPEQSENLNESQTEGLREQSGCTDKQIDIITSDEVPKDTEIQDEYQNEGRRVQNESTEKPIDVVTSDEVSKDPEVQDESQNEGPRVQNESTEKPIDVVTSDEVSKDPEVQDESQNEGPRVQNESTEKPIDVVTSDEVSKDPEIQDKSQNEGRRVQNESTEKPIDVVTSDEVSKDPEVQDESQNEGRRVQNESTQKPIDVVTSDEVSKDPEIQDESQNEGRRVQNESTEKPIDVVTSDEVSKDPDVQDESQNEGRRVQNESTKKPIDVVTSDEVSKDPEVQDRQTIYIDSDKDLQEESRQEENEVNSSCNIQKTESGYSGEHRSEQSDEREHTDRNSNYEFKSDPNEINPADIGSPGEYCENKEGDSFDHFPERTKSSEGENTIKNYHTVEEDTSNIVSKTLKDNNTDTTSNELVENQVNVSSNDLKGYTTTDAETNVESDVHKANSNITMDNQDNITNSNTTMDNQCNSDSKTPDDADEHENANIMQEERQQSVEGVEGIYVNDTQDVSDVTNRDLSSAKRHSKISYNTVLSKTVKHKERKRAKHKNIERKPIHNDMQNKNTEGRVRQDELPRLSRLKRHFTRLQHIPCTENSFHGIEDQDEYRFGDGTLLFQENEKIRQTSRVEEILMDLWFTQRTDYTVNKGDRLTYQYFNTNVGFAKSSTKVSRKEFLFDRQSTFDCRFAETLKRIDINKPREDSFFLPSPRSQCRKLKAYANLQKKLSQVLRQ